MNYIEFKDKGFERAVKRFLRVSAAGVLEDDLKRLSGVIISDKDSTMIPIPWQSDSSAFAMNILNFNFNINDSDNNLWHRDLVNFSHIISLHLNIHTEDLSWLKDFKNLKELYVENSTNNEWLFLTTLKRLKFLSVKDSKFTDLNPIRNLYVSQFEEYEKIRKDVKQRKLNIFEGLQHLEIINCGLSDISPLSHCSWVIELNLSHNNIYDITPLKRIRHLYYLTLRYNNVTDISPLKNLRSIYYINLRHNKITNIEIFESPELDNLSRLYLEDNMIMDFSPVRKLKLVHHDIEQYSMYKKEERKARGKNRVQNNIVEIKDVSGSDEDIKE